MANTTEIVDRIALSRLLVTPVFLAVADGAGAVDDAVAFDGRMMTPAQFYAFLALAAFAPPSVTAPDYLGRRLWLHQSLSALNGEEVDTDALINALRQKTPNVEGLKALLDTIETEMEAARRKPFEDAGLARKLRSHPAFPEPE